MRIWIDATRHDERIGIFGMTLLERVLRTLVQAQQPMRGLQALDEELRGVPEVRAWIHDFIDRRLVPSEVRVELAPDGRIPADLPRDLLARLPVVFAQGQATVRDRLAEALRDADGETLIALSADTVLDVRAFEHLVWAREPLALLGGTGDERGAMLRLDGPLPPAPDGEDDLVSIAETCLHVGAVKRLDPDAFDGHVRELRRNQLPWLFTVRDARSAAKLERFLFWCNGDGAADFLSRYLLPPLVWRVLGPLAERRTPPNAVTAVGILCCLAAVPFFAAGWWLPGLLLAYAMAVLDSVDGKLARLTFRCSRQGAVLDHAIDLVHAPLWYGAWAWGLSGGDPASGVFQAFLWGTGLYVVDRLLESLLRSCNGGGSVRDHTPLDAKLRGFVSRRNLNLAIFTIALPLGLGVEGFYTVLGLQLATAIHHLVRVVQCWEASESPTPGTRATTLEPAR